MSPRTHRDNAALAAVIAEAAVSHAALAKLINELATRQGLTHTYSHTSIANWTRRGVTPAAPTPRLIAEALSGRLGRHVTLAQIGMVDQGEPPADVGLAFPRDLGSSVQAARELWSQVDRRQFLSAGGAFTIGAYSTPIQRWLITPADPGAAHAGGRRVGESDLESLRDAIGQARHWDSRFGGGDWRTSSLNRCLQDQATPLLGGTYRDAIGRSLFSAVSELSRLAGFTAFDRGQHDLAQRYYVTALRLARAAGDVPLGGYVLSSMAMQSLSRGFPNEAIDMAQAASERTRGAATPRTAAFFSLIEARAHAHAGDSRSAELALSRSAALLDRATSADTDPSWIDFYGPERFAADATEVYRDLRRPDLAVYWNDQADPMPAGIFTRSVGMRQAIMGTSRLHAGELDEGIAYGRRAMVTLSEVRSVRAKEYFGQLLAELSPWAAEPSVRAFTVEAARFLAA